MGTADPAYRNGSSPTVLLVHGGFSDASSWAGVVPALLAAGLDVLAPANPLRGLAADAAYVAGVAGEIDGPVLLVGHAYGGAVITAAGTQAGNVVGLVYVAAFALDAGESVLDVAGRFPASRLGPALCPAPCWGTAGEPGVELYVKRDAFPAVLAADLPKSVTAVLAVTQRPIAAAALDEKARGAAWKTRPSWYAVAAADQAVHPEAQRFMARRAGARTVEVDASHTVLVSRAGPVADLIRAAAGGAPAAPSRLARARGP